ncbi:hypothetical protein XI02_13750 [Bradyrhizobium sp. CCBAU 21365]|nr:hypothetical protein XI02_13750 [Bradyrhizobium sp. CCBAU 21365]
MVQPHGRRNSLSLLTLSKIRARSATSSTATRANAQWHSFDRLGKRGTEIVLRPFCFET